MAMNLYSINLGGGGGGGGTPGGANTSVQFNNGGAFGGFGLWDGTTFSLEGGFRPTNGGAGPTIKAADFAADYDVTLPDSAPTADNQTLVFDGVSSFFWELPTIPNFVGDSGAGGTAGAVPAPAAGDATKYLKGDGAWAAIAAGIVGTVGTTDNVIPRADGTGGSTVQASLASIDDNGWMSIPDTDGTRYRFGSGNVPALIYSASSLLLQPGSGTTVGIAGIGLYRGGVLTVETTSFDAIVYINGGTSTNAIVKGANRDGISADAQNVFVLAGDQTVNTFAGVAGNLVLGAGNTNSNNAASTPGNASLLGGIGTHASNNNPGGDVTIAPGTSAGSGGNGNLILTNIKTATAASDAMTMRNGPTGTAGNPTRFIRVVVDGSNYIMPLWPG